MSRARRLGGRVGDRNHDRERQGRRRRQGLESSAALAQRAAAHRRQEQPAVAATHHRGHERVRQRRVGRHRCERAVAVTQQCRPGDANPETPVSIRDEAQNRPDGWLARHRMAAAGVNVMPSKRTRPFSAPIHRYPSGRLRDGVDGTTGKPLLAAPFVAHVLRHVPRGIHRVRRRHQEGGRDDGQQPCQARARRTWATGGTRTSQ